MAETNQFFKISTNGVTHQRNPNTTASTWCGRDIAGAEEAIGPVSCGSCIKSMESQSGKKLPRNPNDTNHPCHTCGLTGFTKQGLWQHKTYSKTHALLAEGDRRQLSLMQFTNENCLRN